MRNIGTAAPVLPERAPGPGTWDLRIEAVTPIYKGGSNPKGIDHGIPFRGPSLKGLLRSWWRATQETSDVDTLRRQEATLFGEVFGDGQRASQVSVGVTEQACIQARESRVDHLGVSQRGRTTLPRGRRNRPPACADPGRAGCYPAGASGDAALRGRRVPFETWPGSAMG